MAQQDGDTPKHGRSAVCFGAYRLAIGFATHTTGDDNDREVVRMGWCVRTGAMEAGSSCVRDGSRIFVCMRIDVFVPVGRALYSVCLCVCVCWWVGCEGMVR